MAEKRDNHNPRAFSDGSTFNPGMSLRDYFAAAAIGSKINNCLLGYEDYAPEHRAELIRRIARDCWEIADAMLRARAKE